MKLAILDKDGTLIRPKSGQRFVQSPEDQELIPGVAEAIDKLIADDFSIVIASNQGGCTAINPATGKPYKTIKEAIEEMMYCLALLENKVSEAMFCPDFEGRNLYLVISGYSDVESVLGNRFRRDPKSPAMEALGNPNFRKPNPGMLELAMWRNNLLQSPQMCLMIGDRSEDFSAAEAAGVRFVWAHDWLRSDTIDSGNIEGKS